MTEWKEYKIKESPFEIIDGDRGKNYPSQDEFFRSGYCLFLSTKNVRQTGFDFSESQFITIEKDNLLRKGKLARFDTILTTRGTVGNVTFYGNDVPYNNLRINSGMVIIRPNKERIDPRYCFYLFRSLQKSFETYTSGSAQPQLPIRDLNEMEILLPPLSEQQSIASILSSLDNKIDLLHRQNQTIEALAETLFRQWFVEEAEERWEAGKLGDVIETIESGSRPKGGIDPKLREGIPSIGAENINGLGYYDYSKTKFITQEFYNSMKRGIIKNYDVLIYKDGAYIGRKGMFANGFPYDICTVNEHVFILRANPRVNQIFLYFLLNQEDLEQLNANSAQPGLNQESMKSFEIVIPPNELIKKFEEIVKVWIDKIFFNCNQIRTLTRLRDTLLPKLMSGEVRVKELELLR